MHILIIIGLLALYATLTVLFAVLFGYVAGIYFGAREVARYRAIQKAAEKSRPEGIALDVREPEQTNNSDGSSRA